MFAGDNRIKAAVDVDAVHVVGQAVAGDAGTVGALDHLDAGIDGLLSLPDPVT